MSSENDRTPPDDPSSITLTYQHRHYWWFSADDAPETWHVSADIDDGGPHVGDMDITLVDTYETHPETRPINGQLDRASPGQPRRESSRLTLGDANC